MIVKTNIKVVLQLELKKHLFARLYLLLKKKLKKSYLAIFVVTHIKIVTR